MQEKVMLFENKYVQLFIYLRGFVCGLIAEDERIEIILPFFVIALKKENSSFIRNYGEFFVGLFIGWMLFIIFSHIIL
jgi:hypothetical protein